MTKRVSISYTVDLEEVPQRVQILMNELAVTLNALAEVSKDAATKSLNSSSQGETGLDGIKEILRLKVLLGKAQERTDDCFNILKGFLQMEQQEFQPPPPPPAPPPEPVKKKSTTKKKAKKKTKKKKSTKKKEEE
tara:strand:+ start:576 stop:980 length:405 start_codon:yes stop_codon:yes gene_type:complete